ncbi:hypothetical protein M2140_001933 [Clostridiales Family XIII bacterium PM5-7]
MKKYLFNLHQFEGEGTGGNGGDAGHEESGIEEVVYGRQEEPAGTEASEDSHDADDDQDGEQERRKAFEDLIKGDYKDLFDERVRENIDRRFKNVHDSQEELNRVSESLMPLYERYGVDAGDWDGLEEAIRNDTSLFAEEAEEMGLTPQQYLFAKNAELEARRAQTELERVKGAQEAQKAYQGWLREGEELKKTYPEFDLAQEVQNDKFMALLKQDWNVADAYEAVHAKELITNGIGTAAVVAQKNVVDSIRARGMRPTENGTGNKAGVIVKNDPSKFDNRDMEEIRKRVLNGEKIKF